MMADFHVTIDSVWQNDGTFEVLRHSQPTPTDARSVRLQGVFSAAMFKFMHYQLRALCFRLQSHFAVSCI